MGILAHPSLAGVRQRARQFDVAIEQQVDRVRGNPVADRVFYAASELGDWSLIWHLIAAGRALGGEQQRKEAVRMAVILGVESAVVNGLVKSLFNRRRPIWDDEISGLRPKRLRQPRTSSFPSGHASSAACAASLLSEGRSARSLWWTIAGTVAFSRVYVKIHHPSDVVAGAVTGLVIARIAQRAWPRPE